MTTPIPSAPPAADPLADRPPDGPIDGLAAPAPLAGQVRSALIWRSGSQIVAQLVQWSATFLVIRILDPRDYGLYAMTGVILVFLNMLNGYGLASGLIQRDDVSARQVRQSFGMLIALNLVLAMNHKAGRYVGHT